MDNKETGPAAAEAQNEQLKIYLHEAVDMLDDIKDKLGMFQTQRYYRLKKELERLSLKIKE